jgi:zinc D-Ala-D-Ala carboxypeptidase
VSLFPRRPASTARESLAVLGFRGTYADVTAFQAGWCLGAPLTVDGILGPKTSAAIQTSLRRRYNGQPDLSEHFWWTEFACRCNRAACARIRVDRRLVAGLERLRALAYPRGLTITSGYRCPAHNAAVGGATESQHVHGTAADLPPAADAAAVAALQVFSGIGSQGTTAGPVRHVDVRHVTAATNTTHSSPAHPARWTY